MEIVVYHVGGGDDDIGPTEALIDNLKPFIRLVLFDARPGSTEVGVETIKTSSGVKADLVTVGVDEKKGNSDFFVNKFPLSSSLLPSSPQAASENPNWEHCNNWGENTELDFTIQVPTDSIDSLINSGKVPSPDFLSIDAQGAELSILRGASEALNKSILGLVTETEFFEIYKNQGLIGDQLNFLEKYAIRLAEIYAQQNWYSAAAVGSGFLTVGETLFLKYAINPIQTTTSLKSCMDVKDLTPDKIKKLALISYAFNRISYSYFLLNYLKENYLDNFLELKSEKHLTKLFYIYESIDLGICESKLKKNYFIKRPPFPITYNRIIDNVLYFINYHTLHKIKRVVKFIGIFIVLVKHKKFHELNKRIKNHL